MPHRLTPRLREQGLSRGSWVSSLKLGLSWRQVHLGSGSGQKREGQAILRSRLHSGSVDGSEISVGLGWKQLCLSLYHQYWSWHPDTPSTQFLFLHHSPCCMGLQASATHMHRVRGPELEALALCSILWASTAPLQNGLLGLCPPLRRAQD